MLALAPGSPFELMEQVESEMDGWFGGLSAGAPVFAPLMSTAVWTPATTAYTHGGKFVVRCEVPGVEPSDLHVRVVNGTLIIAGERKASTPSDDTWVRGASYGSFERRYTLPEGIDATAVKATYHNGVLEVTVPLPKEVAGISVPITFEKALPA
ncbi:MAG TPA: Hsp20/alpha crystallin family protein [Candidatus Tectomicrobia bacterium]|nr:Hsp20/alpha crystallin family protein [Candidatus Tectomicrobia bacterium]